LFLDVLVLQSEIILQFWMCSKGVVIALKDKKERLSHLDLRGYCVRHHSPPVG